MICQSAKQTKPRRIQKFVFYSNECPSLQGKEAFRPENRLKKKEGSTLEQTGRHHQVSSAARTAGSQIWGHGSLDVVSGTRYDLPSAPPFQHSNSDILFKEIMTKINVRVQFTYVLFLVTFLSRKFEENCMSSSQPGKLGKDLSAGRAASWFGSGLCGVIWWSEWG